MINWIFNDLISVLHTAAARVCTGPNQSQDRSHGPAVIFVPTEDSLMVLIVSIFEVDWSFTSTKVIYIFLPHTHQSRPGYKKPVILSYISWRRSFSCLVITGKKVNKYWCAIWQCPFSSKWKHAASKYQNVRVTERKLSFLSCFWHCNNNDTVLCNCSCRCCHNPFPPTASA